MRRKVSWHTHFNLWDPPSPPSAANPAGSLLSHCFMCDSNTLTHFPHPSAARLALLAAHKINKNYTKGQGQCMLGLIHTNKLVPLTRNSTVSHKICPCQHQSAISLSIIAHFRNYMYRHITQSITHPSPENLRGYVPMAQWEQSYLYQIAHPHVPM